MTNYFGILQPTGEHFNCPKCDYKITDNILLDLLETGECLQCGEKFKKFVSDHIRSKP